MHSGIFSQLLAPIHMALYTCVSFCRLSDFTHRKVHSFQWFAWQTWSKNLQVSTNNNHYFPSDWFRSDSIKLSQSRKWLIILHWLVAQRYFVLEHNRIWTDEIMRLHGGNKMRSIIYHIISCDHIVTFHRDALSHV